jgi:hypothetical protein
MITKTRISTMAILGLVTSIVAVSTASKAVIGYRSGELL